MKKILLSIILFGSLTSFAPCTKNSVNENVLANYSDVTAFRVTVSGYGTGWFNTSACARAFSVLHGTGTETIYKVTVDESLVIICL